MLNWRDKNERRKHNYFNITTLAYEVILMLPRNQNYERPLCCEPHDTVSCFNFNALFIHIRIICKTAAAATTTGIVPIFMIVIRLIIKKMILIAIITIISGPKKCTGISPA